MADVAVASEPLQRILVIDDDRAVLSAFQSLSDRIGCECSVMMSGLDVMEHISGQSFDLIVLDLNLPGLSSFELLEDIRTNHYETEVIVVTGQATVQSAVQSLKKGAYDYLTKPFEDMIHVERTLVKALEKTSLVRRLRSYEKHQGELQEFAGLVGKNAEMHKIYQMIENISHSNSNVLIQGESGTGKELVARAIYQNSPRAREPFVVINCSALAETLLESELFGHVKGAFTGALQDKKGLFTEASGGTIFLDEIGEVPLPIQVKLLRVLQDGEVRPLGADRAHHVDIRIIAATNRDLRKAMREGQFREDLFYRLNVIGMRLPPLRERREDIPLLAYHFLKKYAKRMNKIASKISVDAMQSLQGFRWMGNVRELENVVERALVLSNGDTVTARDLPPRMLREVFYERDEESASQNWVGLSYRDAKERALMQYNQRYIGGLLKMTQGNISLASQRAGMDRNNFKKIIKKYEINAKAYKKSN